MAASRDSKRHPHRRAARAARPARRSAPARKRASGRTRAPAKRRRTGQTPVGGLVPVAVGVRRRGRRDRRLGPVRLADPRPALDRRPGRAAGRDRRPQRDCPQLQRLVEQRRPGSRRAQAPELGPARPDRRPALQRARSSRSPRDLGLVMPVAGLDRLPAQLARRREERRRAAAQRRAASPATSATSVGRAPVDTTVTTDPALPVDDHGAGRDHRPGRARDRRHGAGRRPRPVEAPAAPAAQPAGDRHGLDRGGGRRSVNLIDRRIGLLFAACGRLLGSWFSCAPSGSRGSRAARSATRLRASRSRRSRCPGRAGRSSTATGSELAVSEDAATIFATPYQVKDPAATAHSSRRSLDMDQDEILKALADRESGLRLPRAQGRPRRRARRSSELDLPGIGMLPDSRRIYPQGELAAQVIGAVGIDNQGLTGLEAAEDELLHGDDGERQVVHDALGDELERDTVAAATSRRGPAADDRRRASRPRPSEVLAEVGEHLQPEGRDGDRHGPAAPGDPGDGRTGPGSTRPIPATPRPSELGNMATGFTYEPGSTFKAFTVAGALEEGLVTPRHDVRPAADDPGRRPHDRGVARRAATVTPHASPTSSPSPRTSARSRSGCELGARALRPLDATGSASARPTGVEFPGEEQGIVSRARRLLGLDDGQPADRPGPLGDADADGRRLRGDRQRRHPAHAAADRSTTADRSAEDAGQAGDQQQTDAAELRARCSRACSRPGGTASEVSVPGYTLAGKTGTAQKVDPRRRLLGDQVRRLVRRLRPGPGPAAAGRGGGRRARRATTTAATVAAPAFGEIAEFALPYLRIPPQ